MRGNQFIQSLARVKYKLALGSLLVAASILSVVIQRVHTWVNGEDSYANLVFNLGLAWIPFGAAVLAYLASHKRITFYLIMPFCTLVWLIFFPNAPYLLTDFQHLAFTNGSAPLWFDVILMIWFAWTGLLLGIASLYLMQEIVTKTFTPLVGWVFAISATILSSFGVYLGRFLRWNSWDLLYDPIPIKGTGFLDTNRTIAPISPLLFGGFAEHMGRCVYEGIYDPDLPWPTKTACARMCWKRCATRPTP
jgi:uncharacterized membrane protein